MLHFAGEREREYEVCGQFCLFGRQLQLESIMSLVSRKKREKETGDLSLQLKSLLVESCTNDPSIGDSGDRWQWLHLPQCTSCAS